MKITNPHGKKILVTSAVAALLFATGCQANNATDSSPSPETTEQQTVTEEASPTVTETATETATETTEPTDSEFSKGESVSTTNGAFTITPVGDWKAELEDKGESSLEGYDRVETINLSYGDTAEGAVETGVITDLDGVPLERQQLNSWRLEQLDVPGSENETYLVESLIFNDVEEKWTWRASIVAKTPEDDSEYDGVAYLVDRQPSAAFVFVANVATTTGEESKAEAQEFQKSQARDEAIEMLKNFEAEPKA